MRWSLYVEVAVYVRAQPVKRYVSNGTVIVSRNGVSYESLFAVG